VTMTHQYTLQQINVSRAKHVEIDYHIVREKIEERTSVL